MSYLGFFFFLLFFLLFLHAKKTLPLNVELGPFTFRKFLLNLSEPLYIDTPHTFTFIDPQPISTAI